MHIPEGFINGATSAGAAVAAAGGVAASLRSSAARLADRQVPMAGLAAAFIFVLQMLNFPVAAGTTGHLLGGALATILLGPGLGITVVAVVVVVQALIFADGGLSALGLNVVNMAIVTSLVAWAVHRLGMTVRRSQTAVLVTSMVAAWASVVASSAAFSMEYLIGGRGGVEPATVLGAMLGTHALIGIGEGIITSTIVGAVLAVRPDLVWGARGLDDPRSAGPLSRRVVGGFVAAGLVAATLLVVFVAPNAASDPDGLERVALDTGFAESAVDSIVGGPFAGYGFQGIDEPLGTIVAGMVGMVVTFAAGLIVAGVVRRLRRRAAHP